MTCIPQDDKTRKAAPMFLGLIGYFGAALFRVAAHSLKSDRKHNPKNPDPPKWARQKSTDHADCIVRHLADAYGPPPEPTPEESATPGFVPWTQESWTQYHLDAIAWRGLALLQEHCEARGASPGPSSAFPKPEPPAERWGVFWGERGEVRRSGDVLGEYPTREAAQAALDAYPYPNPNRFVQRLTAVHK